MNERSTDAVLITGASGGIGGALARRLAAEGASLVLHGRHEARLSALRDELGGRVEAAITGDLTVREDRARLASAVRGRLRGVALVAGCAPFGSVADTDEASWDAAFALNVKSRFFLVQALLERLAPGAAIVMVSASIADRPLPESSAFAASMEASRALARCLAVDLRARGVRVCTVSPGPTDTPIYEGYGMPEEALAGLKESLGARTLAGRMGRADEIASAIAFLLGCPFADGVDVVVDGGYRLA